MIASAGLAQSGFLGSISKVRGTYPVPETPPPALPSGRNPAISSEEMARSYAGIAEGSIGAINQAIQQYAYYKSDEYRDAINSPKFKEHIERIREMYGDETADSVVARVQPENMMASERQRIEVYAGNVWGHLNISGSLYNYDAATDTFSPGQFTLSVNAGYFAVKADSASGVVISTDGKPYRDFVRNYVPYAEFLPYKITDQNLFDIVA